MESSSDTFTLFFQAATGRDGKPGPGSHEPYPYQTRLALGPIASRLIYIPTGCGKTAATILAWLWRRKTDPKNTPRRLVYCLPMRVLVEQTSKNAETWLQNLGLQDKVGLHVLMGGEEVEDWDLYPERDAILIGTQDMLLSRALNRGYGMSRYRWPMHFGLLNNDCLWVFDEIQLMGSGLATTAQLEAFRGALGQTGCHSFWMSATLQRDWLRTVDFDPAPLALHKLEDDDLARKDVSQIREARKRLHATHAQIGDAKRLAEEIIAVHTNAGGLTLVVVNSVQRARELHAAVERQVKGKGVPAILIHSRFRPPDRKKQVDSLLAEPGEHGAIVVSTQVVEAGVDVSARTLFTELAPWPSLVQRFGRCNRRGADNDTARAFWIDLPKDEKDQEKVRYPYELDDLKRSRDLLRACKDEDVSPASLEAIPFTQELQHAHVIRRKDFIDLFDTTPDLAGNDIDIDRYVREIEDSDVRAFWREWPASEPPLADMPGPRREDLCAVPIGELRDLLKDAKRRTGVYRWDSLDRRWLAADSRRVYPGQVYLLRSDVGGYGLEQGWNLKLDKAVHVIEAAAPTPPPEANDDDQLSEFNWQSIAEHTDRVCSELESILGALSLPESQALKLAARWHDWGKAHCIFQDAIGDGQTAMKRGKSIQRPARPSEYRGSLMIAKAPGKVWADKKLIDPGFWRAYGRRHFRHELASALTVLQQPHNCLASLADDDLNLIAYLIAAHHGKVRLSIRSLPGEKTPSDGHRFARGVWDGDKLPATDLGGGVIAPAVTLSLEPMELGLCEQPPFTGQPSWAERMLRLRDKLDPCRLAYLEAILRAADMRASKDAHSKEKPGA